MTSPVPAGSGLEFVVFRAWSRDLGEVALRVPRLHQYAYAGREPFSARRALEQEHLLCAHLHPLGLPVAEPLALVDTAAAPVLVSRFLRSDRTGARPEQVGRLLARLHQVPPPTGIVPIDHDGFPFDVAIARRVSTRWAWLGEVTPDLPPLPALPRLIELLAPLAERPRLLHLDIRACNLISTEEEVSGLFDWGCAMLGHPALELARAAENAPLPENEVDIEPLLAGYRREAPVPRVDPRVDTVLRLDGVTMLSVVFAMHAPDPQRRAVLLDRTRTLAAALC
nr:aminoglycoside phosphotransferase family protein [Planosporangium thailandense]